MKIEKYQIGVDLAIKPSWLKRFLVWLGIRKRNWDYSCMVIGKVKRGVLEIKDIIRF